VYIFNKGDGEDRIFDTNGSDTIQFGAGIKPDDVIAKVVSGSNGSANLELSIKNTNDKITVYRHFGYFDYSNYGHEDAPYQQIEKVTFADGTIWDLETIHDKAHNMSGTDKEDNMRVLDKSATTLHGLAGNDSLVGGIANDLLYGDAGDDTLWGDAGNDTLIGGQGDDSLRGGEGNDILHGDAGNDELWGGVGNDTLVGGTGNDHLEGGEGNDAYVFSKGDGEDRIFDANGLADEIRLGHESVDVVFERVNSSLRVRMPGSLDAITIDSWYNGDAYKIETFKSTDGNVITHTQIESLIQAMASFQNDTGMTWEQALSEQPSQVRSIVQEYWTVPTV
ncbi:MAG: calcium-binding protein, partial [Candidatus Saccharimonas sp.]